jgi:hypothetical protein
MLRGADLRGVTNRKMRIDGEYIIPNHRQCLILPEFAVFDDEGKERKIINAGDTVTIVSAATFRVIDRVVTVRPHPELFKLGMLQYLPVVSMQDEDVKVEIKFTATQRADIRRLGYIAELYVGE